MKDDCPRCELHFERIEGHWIGAIGINTIVSFGLLALTIAGGLIATFPDFKTTPLIITGILVSILAPTVFFPVSRTLWTAIDISMRPLEDDEADWSIVDPEGTTPASTAPASKDTP